MKLCTILEQHANFNNWTFPSEETIRSDFSEYKKKEEMKWRGRAQRMGFRFPIFNEIEDFERALRNGKVVTVTEQVADQVTNLATTDSLGELRDLVSTYVRPRDVDRIVNGFENKEPIPYPIFLKGNNGIHIMAGNTRINAARILGVTPKALVLDVREK